MAMLFYSTLCFGILDLNLDNKMNTLKEALGVDKYYRFKEVPYSGGYKGICGQ